MAIEGLAIFDHDPGSGSINVADRHFARGTDFQSGTLWKYAQTVGPAHEGAVTHPGAKAETHVYADI